VFDGKVIVQILDGYRFGGAERVALTYRRSFTRLHVENEIFAIDVGDRVGGGDVRLLGNYFRVFLAVFSHACKRHVVCFTHTTRSLYICCIVKVLFPFRIRIVHIRHFPLRGFPAKLIRAVNVLVFRYISIAPRTNCDSPEFDEGKLRYINNYIDDFILNTALNPMLGKIPELVNGRIVLGFSGAMKEGKNPEDVIRVLSLLDTSKYCCLMIGDGPKFKFSKDLSQELGCSDHVIFCGYQEDVNSFLDFIDYYFFPSWNEYEVMPMALLEAMKHGCICFGYEMDIVRKLLPESNVFKYQQYDVIAAAIACGGMKHSEMKFDAEYGDRELLRLLMETV